jgi:hypothetical protein
MKTLLLAALTLISAVALAQETLEGTWRMNLQDTQYVGTEKYNLKDGQFTCTTCDPKIDVKADGQDHPFTSPYADTINVKVTDDHAIEITGKKAGKITNSMKIVASPDGKTLTTQFTTIPPSGQKVDGKYGSTRVGSAVPAGVHKINGEWQPGKLDSVSDNAMEFTYSHSADTWTYADKTGNSYSAKLDGKDYPYKGDPGVSTVSLRQLDPKTLEETYKRDGKVILVNKLTLGPDGKTLSVNAHDTVRDVTVKYTATKR